RIQLMTKAARKSAPATG
nr:Chain B, Histone 3 peptide H3(17-33)K18IA21M [Homo sapiens]